MNDKKIFKSIIKTSEALDRWSSNRNRKGQAETSIRWGRVLVVLIGILISVLIVLKAAH